MLTATRQLVSYIAPAAPATRRPADGDEPFVRPEIGFTPAWFRQHLDIDFGQTFHTDVAYRRDAVLDMRRLLRQHFGGSNIGGIQRPDHPLDLLTGTFGACNVAAIFGLPILYAADNWPNVQHDYLSPETIDNLTLPDLDENDFFRGMMQQVERIAQLEGQVVGYINWQGVLNNAQRLRGQELFTDLYDHPQRCDRLFDCVTQTMLAGIDRLHVAQRATGVEQSFITVSNCLVNMLAPQQYERYLLPHDMRLAHAFECIGVHNCAWTADPYLEFYARLPGVGYIDMGIHSDLVRAKALFPDARRAVMYTPMDLRDKSIAAVNDDLAQIGQVYGPCDVVIADIEAGTPDDKIEAVLERCRNLG
ncbi:MAG: hypothetical protein IT445_11385 [Phycisphaeraceae bacterium]|nr:hypothetical protein [Phycisphaeraceae bacterium]